MDKEDEKKKYIVGIVFAIVMLIAALIIMTIFIIQNQRLKEKCEFESVKQGLCVYVETYYSGYKTEYTYCLVYDEEIDKVIEVDLSEDLIHGHIRVGDSIIYVVNYDYTDADFLNVIYQ